MRDGKPVPMLTGQVHYQLTEVLALVIIESKTDFEDPALLQLFMDYGNMQWVLRVTKRFGM
jgi:hypothetical protein